MTAAVDLADLTVAELAPRIRTGELSPVALTEALLTRIEAHREVHAFRIVTAERALSSARAAQAQIEAGHYLGPLHGIPYVTKDLFDVAGLPTTAGSAVHEDRVAASDCAVTRRLAQAGMVLLGKTHTVEFAFGSVGINHSQGTPRNPWAEEHYVPGGSSSGTAVAVSAGLAPLGTGTDTACSVRTPASLCGIVGLKTSTGRIPRSGVYPLSSTLDSVGPLTRCVEDAAWMFDAMQGPDEKDASTLGVDRVDVLRTLHDGVAGLRVTVAEGFQYEDLDEDVEAAVRATEKVFESLGAHVARRPFAEAAEVMNPPSVISLVEGYAVNREAMESKPEQLDPVVRDRMAGARNVSGADYVDALNRVQRLRRSVRRTFDRTDVLIAPTCMIPARPLADIDQGQDVYMRYAGNYLRNCFVGNLLNLSAVTVPCGYTRDGLPIGLMIQAAPFGEAMALRVAYAYEQATLATRRRAPGMPGAAS